MLRRKSILAEAWRGACLTFLAAIIFLPLLVAACNQVFAALDREIVLELRAAPHKETHR